MKLKVDANGHAVLLDGKPVYVRDDSTEVAVDVAKVFGDLHRVNGESAERRLKIVELEARVQAFGDLDPAAAREALAKGGKGGNDELRKEIEKGFAKKLEDGAKALDAAKGQIRSLMIDSAIKTSPFVKDRLTYAPEHVVRLFGDCFSVEDVDGKPAVVAKIGGKPLFSRDNPAQYASIDEALSAIIAADPMRDVLLKGGAPGQGGAPKGNPSGKTTPANGLNQKPSTWELKDKLAFIGEHGQEAYQTLLSNEGKSKE